MGINYFIFVSAVLFGIGLITVVSAKGGIRNLTGILLMFFSCIINLAAIGGFWGFNPESRILIFLISAVCLIHLSAGAIMFYKYYIENSKAVK
ncbi:MAG: hypothetical protein IT280_06120 [Ignavibacteria bacterium]|nr:hypothetical protein [Ignavibacteria bacterium]